MWLKQNTLSNRRKSILLISNFQPMFSIPSRDSYFHSHSECSWEYPPTHNISLISPPPPPFSFPFIPEIHHPNRPICPFLHLHHAASFPSYQSSTCDIITKHQVGRECVFRIQNYTFWKRQWQQKWTVMSPSTNKIQSNIVFCEKGAQWGCFYRLWNLLVRIIIMLPRNVATCRSLLDILGFGNLVLIHSCINDFGIILLIFW